MVGWGRELEAGRVLVFGDWLVPFVRLGDCCKLGTTEARGLWKPCGEAAAADAGALLDTTPGGLPLYCCCTGVWGPDVDDLGGMLLKGVGAAEVAGDNLVKRAWRSTLLGSAVDRLVGFEALK